jgi:capsular polysaccharide transport system permease protein
MSPAELQPLAAPTLADRLRSARRSYGWFLGVVVLPCLLAAAYLYLFAADQYVSEAHYLVRNQNGTPTQPTGLAAMLGGGGGGAAAAMGGTAEANSVADYLTSHDVVDTLRLRIGLVDRFRRPEADLLSRLPDADPTPEALLKFYKRQVDVHFDMETGITDLTVRAFRPGDAYTIARTLLSLGEERINQMNRRAYADAVTLARRQLDEAERDLGQVQGQLTGFRQAERDPNPVGTAQAQTQLVSELTARLVEARAGRATTARLIGTRNPQYAALDQQVRSLEAQVAGQSGRLAGGSNTIAAGLGNYERLQLQRDTLARRYETASTAYEQARQQAVKQNLYVVRIVDANLPVKSLYPRRGLILLTLLATLLVVYGIGWLIVAGVREHAA